MSICGIFAGYQWEYLCGIYGFFCVVGEFSVVFFWG